MARDFSKMGDEELRALVQANLGGEQQPQQSGYNKDSIAGILSKISPLLTNTLVGGMQGAVASSDTSSDYQKFVAQENYKKKLNPYDDQIKANQARTSTPEFEMKKAQVMADMKSIEAMELEDMKQRREVDNYNRALAAEGGGQINAGQPNQTMPQSIQQTQPTQVPQQQTGQISPFVNVPTREYDPKLGQFTDKTTVKDNPKYKALFDPIAGDSATKFSGAKQAKSSVQDLLKLLKLSPTGIMTSSGQPEYKSKIPPQQRVFDKIQQDAAASNGLIFGKNIPIISDVLKLPQVLADQNARMTNTEYLTLAEDILRARTGAAAPEPEFVRELARSLNTLGDDPTVVANKLSNNEQFVDDVIESIRPGYLEYHGLKRANTGQNTGQNTGNSDPGGFLG